MSNTHTNTNIQAYTIWENEENFFKNTYSSKYSNIYHSSHRSYIKRYIEHEEKQNSESIVICSMFCINEFWV